MGLSVIGAGFGRTGTLTAKLALEALGFRPCHHMAEIFASPQQRTIWRSIAQGQSPDWNAAFAGFRAAVDWPSAYFWRQTSAFYPEAKILLTMRDSESWHASFSKTILPHIVQGNDPETLGVRLIAQTVFHGRPDDRAHAISVYEKNNADVQRAFPKDRLLVYELGAGWAPLCRFLGAPVPDLPFPQTNSADEFPANTEAFERRDRPLPKA